MDAERMRNAETADELKEAAGTGAGPSGLGSSETAGGPREESRDSFYGDTDIYPAAGGLMPPTGHLDRPSPSEGISEVETEEGIGEDPGAPHQ